MLIKYNYLKHKVEVRKVNKIMTNAKMGLEPYSEVWNFRFSGQEFHNISSHGFDAILLVTAQSENNILEVETLGSSNILINYDTYSLISKDGKIWSFEIDSPVEFNVVMPQNSVIVGMSTFPIDMNVDSDRTNILLPSGIAEITYFLAVAESSQILPPVETSVIKDDNSMIYVVGGAAVAIAAIAAIAIKMKNKPKQIVSASQTTVVAERKRAIQY